ncbi:hypothetical protein [Coleofasciculus sp. E1-EBD-02]|uniref:hypothetical protein n=1 Tax=Coleofasciculus sp. E1-EBD-02 TaxID=3068481 RepID=UPI0032F6CA12
MLYCIYPILGRSHIQSIPITRSHRVDQTASIPGDRVYLGKRRSHAGDRESAIAWKSRYL